MGDDGFYYRDGEKVGFVISVSAGDQVRIDMAQIAALIVGGETMFFQRKNQMLNIML